MIQELKTLLLKDLATLRREVELYPDDASLWRTLPGIANPGGNALGLVKLGSGTLLLTATNTRVLQEIDAAAKAVEEALTAMDPAILDQESPSTMGGKKVTGGLFLLHLCDHLGYHLGQLNYHRRMIG